MQRHSRSYCPLCIGLASCTVMYFVRRMAQTLPLDPCDASLPDKEADVGATRDSIYFWDEQLLPRPTKQSLEHSSKVQGHEERD